MKPGRRLKYADLTADATDAFDGGILTKKHTAVKKLAPKERNRLLLESWGKGVHAHVTDEAVEQAKTANGGFTRAQLAEWGVPWPPPKGWRKKITEQSPGTVQSGRGRKKSERQGGHEE